MVIFVLVRLQQFKSKEIFTSMLETCVIVVKTKYISFDFRSWRRQTFNPIMRSLRWKSQPRRKSCWNFQCAMTPHIDWKDMHTQSTFLSLPFLTLPAGFVGPDTLTQAPWSYISFNLVIRTMGFPATRICGYLLLMVCWNGFLHGLIRMIYVHRFSRWNYLLPSSINQPEMGWNYFRCMPSILMSRM